MGKVKWILSFQIVYETLQSTARDIKFIKISGLFVKYVQNNKVKVML